MSENNEATMENEMVETVENGAVAEQLSEKDKQAKTNAMIAYGCMLVGLFTGIFWIIGAVWAMIKKSDAQGTKFHSHYNNITTTFWVGLGLTIVGIITAAFIIGYLILIANLIWCIYRVVKGLARITSDKAYA
ncbi:hypothetical protein VTH8203_01363 [Vibrio thalassae]|uniref:DUF4870 domain-containing protein n=1 Tax=Vibrio thalassae TaxID=1243014 RepID=A0A240EGC7_9VIBR|nr:hypothetical protein [Vibrio thalassae]SNX47748.1 hypothetical protein VTH8203_01363 [Vibrio thalassae]